ncbi:MAG TPA: DEAD/DEAH box helicase family protein [Chitinophagales bacterium]|nr:DEAD/DEAH box helicase family protein [Chitinophagales bacterium]
MAKKLTLKFDSNQQHQLQAIESVMKLFESMSPVDTSFSIGDEIVPNLPQYQSLSEPWLFDNLTKGQRDNQLQENYQLDIDDGIELEVENERGAINMWRYPEFTIEMETGTGKTYAYLRTIHELKKHYGFRKFIIVVPSIAIYEGTIKTFDITKEHFKTLYGNEAPVLTQYDGQQISKLRGFATSSSLELMVITLDSFNKASNVIYKPTEKLPGEKLPYQYIQETRPILILDECQNYRSETAKAALRTIHPLFALRYSATPIDKPNLIYRLSPVDAFKQNLVKKIEVDGIEHQYNVNHPQLMLAIEEFSGSGYGMGVRLRLPVNRNGVIVEQVLEVKKNADLYQVTKNPALKGLVIDIISKKDSSVVFTNGSQITVQDSEGFDVKKKEEIFRVQIEETIRYHLLKQAGLKKKGVKVLSLFFIDRVANYTADDGMIRKLFDKAFDKIKRDDNYFSKLKAEEVREAYFAKKKNKKGEEEAIDTESKNKEQRDAEKLAFVLIMKDKERLLSFSEKKCFIFAHSALKEGWDSPNVFQICTLNQTVSEIKKRQEIGRGLRLCVNQDGERVIEDGVNVLTVVANESYQQYVSGLQREYELTGDAAPPPPSESKKTSAKRNNKIFKSSDFRDFWKKLCRRTTYTIHIDDEQLIEAAVVKLNRTVFPESQIVITKGKFIITEFLFKLESVTGLAARITLEIKDTDGQVDTSSRNYVKGNDFAKICNDDRLKGFRISEIKSAGDDSFVEFDNGRTLSKYQTIFFQSERGQQTDPRTVMQAATTYPVFNLLERVSRETQLTRPTVLKIFKGLKEEIKKQVFKNPEGFSGIFITTVKQLLADHIADKIEYAFNKGEYDYDLNEVFPDPKPYVQKELIEGTKNSLYNLIQIDSEVERKYVQYRLQIDDEKEKIICYFKFPSVFRIDVPKIIGNYNPDWGIIRKGEDGKLKLQLVRETKGNMDRNLLQYPNEKRKIDCAEKHFKAIGLDYRALNHTIPNWWEKEI